VSSFLWALSAAGIWGVVPVLEKTGLGKIHPLVGLFYRSLGVLIGLLLLGIFVLKPQTIRSVDARSVTFLIASGFLASFAAQICFYNALKTGDVSRVVPVSGAYPLLAFLLGVVFLGETFSMTKAAGCVFIIAGIWLIK